MCICFIYFFSLTEEQIHKFISKLSFKTMQSKESRWKCGLSLISLWIRRWHYFFFGWFSKYLLLIEIFNWFEASLHKRDTKFIDNKFWIIKLYFKYIHLNYNLHGLSTYSKRWLVICTKYQVAWILKWEYSVIAGQTFFIN